MGVAHVIEPVIIQAAIPLEQFKHGCSILAKKPISSLLDEEAKKKKNTNEKINAERVGKHQTLWVNIVKMNLESQHSIRIICVTQ